MSFECLHESGRLEWDLARVRRRLQLPSSYVEVEELYVLVAFEEDGEVCTISYSKILKDQVLLDWFCTRPLSFSSFTYRENVCHGSILHAYRISTTHVRVPCTVTTRVVHVCTAYYTRVQHTTHVYTHAVMPRVLLCKLCACVMRVFCVRHACLLRVARV